MIWLLLIFLGIASIGAALIAIGAGYQDKDFEKAYKLCQTGISIVILDLLGLFSLLLVLY